jgi:CDGSH iron-sulfur domain-containing protein 3
MVTIRVRDDGPYRVDGSVTVVDAEGGLFPIEEGEVVALCRCGHSEEKPFCDGSHRRVGFSSRPRAVGVEEAEGSTAGV